MTHGTPCTHIWIFAVGGTNGGLRVHDVVTALVLIQLQVVIFCHQVMLVITIFVSRETLASIWEDVQIFLKKTRSGMGSSVRVNAVAMENLHHGSEQFFLTQHQMTLRFASVRMKAQIMKILQSSCLRYMFSDWLYTYPLIWMYMHVYKLLPDEFLFLKFEC